MVSDNKNMNNNSTSIIDQAKNMIHESVKTDRQREEERMEQRSDDIEHTTAIKETIKHTVPNDEMVGDRDKFVEEVMKKMEESGQIGTKKHDQQKDGNLIDIAKEKVLEAREGIAEMTKPSEK